MNHCCDANAWYESMTQMTARKDIAKDEEVCYDYGTTELNDTKKLDPCLCGSKFCRGTTTKDDWKLKELREKYKGHFGTHIQALIDKEEKQ